MKKQHDENVRLMTSIMQIKSQIDQSEPRKFNRNRTVMKSKDKGKDNWVSNTNLLAEAEKRNSSVPRLKLGHKIMDTNDSIGGMQMNSNRV